MNERQIITELARKYNFTERRVRELRDIYYGKFVLERMQRKEHDCIELLDLGTIIPRYKVVRKNVHKGFKNRKILKSKGEDPTRVENKLRRDIKLMKILDKANEKRNYKRLN